MEDFVTRNLSGGVWAHCHDVLHMTQLQNDIAQSSGLDPSVNCACVFLFGFVMCFRHSLILMVCVLCCADLVFWDMPYGLLVAPWDVSLTDVAALPVSGTHKPCSPPHHGALHQLQRL